MASRRPARQSKSKPATKAPRKTKATKSAPKRWSQRVTQHSDALDLKRGDEVIVTNQNYPRMITSWQQRARREGIDRPVAEGVPADDVELLRAGLEACSFFWAFYVALGVVAFIVLYVV